MTTTTRAAFAACLFAAFVAGTLAPRMASAHVSGQDDLRAGGTVVNNPSTGGRNIIFSNSHDSIVVRWNAFHEHTDPSELPDPREFAFYLAEFWISLRPPEPPHIRQGVASDDVRSAWWRGCNPQPWHIVRDPLPPGCQHIEVTATDAATYSVRFSGLSPDTLYDIYFKPIWKLKPDTEWPSGWYDSDVWNHSPHGSYVAYNTSIDVKTAAAPAVPPPTTTPTEPETPGTDTNTEPEPETPTEPEAPPEPETPSPPEPETPEPEAPSEPETPEPGSPTCTYEHRLIGVPGTTANAYTGRILVSSKTPGATATIRGFHRDTGLPIDVLDSEGDALTGPVSLDPARSVKRFAIEAVTGWHPVTVEHPSATAMTAATVAMRVREPGGSIEDSYPPGIEHCQPATGIDTPAPDLAVRDAQALLWPNTLDWRATVENIGDGTAQRTTIRLYHGNGQLATQDVRRELTAGSQWPMSHAVNRRNRDDIPTEGATVRVCVDAVPGEPESKRVNNCASVTVELN